MQNTFEDLVLSLVFLSLSMIQYSNSDENTSEFESQMINSDFDCGAFTERDRIFIFYTAWSTWFIIALDWIVLCLYFVKLWEILKGVGWNMESQSEEQFDPKTKMVFDRIRPILIKIVCLTVSYQLAAVAMGMIRGYAEYDGNEYGLVIVHFSNATERVVFALTVVLMIEHNDKWYQRLVDKLKCKCCCLCALKRQPIPLQQVIGADGTKMTKIPHDDDEEEDETKINEQDETSIWSSTEFPILSVQSAPKPIHELKTRY